MKPGAGEKSQRKAWDLENSGWLGSDLTLFSVLSSMTWSPSPHTASLLELIWGVLGGLQGRKPPWERRPERGDLAEGGNEETVGREGRPLLTSPQSPWSL